jgi:hypothetical protein
MANTDITQKKSEPQAVAVICRNPYVNCDTSKNDTVAQGVKNDWAGKPNHSPVTLQ